MKVKLLSSSIQRVVIDSGAKDYSSVNSEYCSKYDEHHPVFQTDYAEILSAYRYSDAILCLAHLNSSELA